MTPLQIQLAKFFSRVDIPSHAYWRQACWEWEGAITTDRPGNAEGGWGGGYGCLTVGGVWYRAHRYLFELVHNKTLDTDDFILHSCDNRKCVNPAHLSKGTSSENLQHQYERGRRG